LASATIEQPGWLAARRERAAALSASLDLPQYKGHPGWEFTDISALDLGAYAPASAGDAGAAERAEALFQGLADPYVLTQVDASTVAIRVPDSFAGNVVGFVTAIESLDIAVDMPAVVILNEKTGTVVMGENVRISTVAVAHGNLSIQIKETPVISQPLPFAPRPPDGGKPYVDRRDGTIVAPGGQTVVAKDTAVGVTEEKRQLMLVSRAVTIQEMVQALNAMGVTPRDLISILQAIKAAGALQAELRII